MWKRQPERAPTLRLCGAFNLSDEQCSRLVVQERV
jgi:hypothetical protein